MPATAMASDLYLEPLGTDSGAARFDLTLDVQETSSHLEARLDYDIDLFDRATAGRLLHHYRILLRAVLSEPRRPLLAVDLLSAGERQQLVLEWGSNRPADYRPDSCIHQLFERQARRSPEAPALVFRGRRWSYRQLDRLANRLAHRLRRLGVRRGVRVGLCVERSPEMVWGLLGILKAGGAYLPLDPDYPEERLAFLVEDADLAVLATQAPLLEGLPDLAASGLRARLLLLDDDWSRRESARDARPPTAADDPDQLAYVIYTSGSTGKPKGSLLAHRGVVNMLSWRQRCFPLGPEDRVLQTDSFSFDASGWQFYWPLLAGSRLVLTRPGGNRDSRYLVELMTREGITVVGFVPSMLRVILEEPGLAACRGVRHLFCGGEALRPELLERFFAALPQTELHNVYGPTEAAIDATDFTLRRPADGGGRPITPIGRPIGNKDLYVLDGHGRSLPIGVAGELFIGGVGLARGYLGRPGLTGDRFVPHPLTERPGARLYRTGDQVRYLPDGNIEFLGRLDHQVKVRGFRIELGEIEFALSRHPAIVETVVVVREDQPGVQRLVAYFTHGDGAEPTVAEVRQFLADTLPRHLVPSFFVALDTLPLNPNGKVERHALPAPENLRPELSAAFTAPREGVEEHLVAIWSAVLGLEEVGIHDNFFELGGDSILSIQIVARAHRQGLHFSPRDVFRHQTVAELAAVVADVAQVSQQQGAVVGPVPLTPIQRWFFDRRTVHPHHFNQALLFEVRQPLAAGLVRRALEQLLQHHDALRLRFQLQDGDWRQECGPPGTPPPFAVLDLAALPEAAQRAAIEAAARLCQASLSLAGPLTRLVLLRLGHGPDRLLWVIHHLAVDGVSWRILLEDLQTAYDQLSAGGVVRLPPKTTSIATWAEHLAAHADSPAAASELEHWRAQAPAGDARLPRDFQAGLEANSLRSARTVRVSLQVEETKALLQDVPRAYRTRIDDVLLAALAQAVTEWSRQPSLLVDREGHGREEVFDGVDLSRTVGWFTVQYPVLLEVGELGSPGALLKGVKEQLRRIPHRGLGYGALRYLGRSPEIVSTLAELPDAEVSFNYFGQLDQALPEASPFTPARESVGATESLQTRRSHVLQINASVRNERLHVSWSFSRNLHRRTTIENLAAGFLEALRSYITHCQSPDAGGVTPSDFPLAGIDQGQLDQIAQLLARTDEA